MSFGSFFFVDLDLEKKKKKTKNNLTLVPLVAFTIGVMNSSRKPGTLSSEG